MVPPTIDDQLKVNSGLVHGTWWPAHLSLTRSKLAHSCSVVDSIEITFCLSTENPGLKNQNIDFGQTF